MTGTQFKNQSGYNEESFVSQIIQQNSLLHIEDRKLVRLFFSEYLGYRFKQLKNL